MRLFVAADLNPEVRARLAGLQDELRGLPLRVSWARPEGIHLTLKFLGEVPPDRRAAIETALRPAGLGIPPFRLEAEGVGTFPERGLPRVIWVGLGGDTGAAERLQRSIERALEAVGFAPESRPFRPHLTLGRVKGAGDGDWRAVLRRSAGARAGRFEVREYMLFESRLGPGGAAYTALARFPLADGGEA